MRKLLLFALLAAQGWAATYYVSTSGNDAYNGTSATYTSGSNGPKRNVSAGVAAATNPGDSVVILDGTYSYEGKPTGNTGSGATVVFVTNTGTAGSHITIQAQHPGSVILDGGATQSADSSTCNGVDQYFTIDGAAYVDFIGLTIQNTCFMGITGASSNSGHDLTFSQMEFRNIARYSGSLPYGQCGMFFNPNMYNIVVDRNLFHDIGRLGGPINPALDHGIYNEANNLTVRNSIFYNFQWGWGYQDKAPATGAALVGNTFYGGNATYGGAIAFDNWTGTIGTISITNNIFLNPPLSRVVHSGNANVTCSYDHNVTDAATFSDTGGCTAGAGNLMSTTASLVSPSTHDFHYNPGSPGIAPAGVAVSGLTTDYAGTTRPNPPSIGAYEYGSAGSPSETISPSSVTFAQPVPVGQTGTEIQYVTISNASGATASLVISSASIAGDFVAGGVGTCGPYPQTLTPGQSCTISLKLAPTASGTRAGTLTITDNATGSPHIVSLTGTTTTDDYAFSVTPTDSNAVAGSARALSIHLTNQAAQPTVGVDFTSHDFGSVTVGVQTGGFAFTLTNTGNAVLAISSITSSGDFSASSNCPISPSTLGIGNSCTITAKFLPTAVGLRSGAVTITDNAADSPQTISLSGTGSAPPPSGSSVGTGISVGRVIIQ